jgi:hypothetical protein
MGQAATLAGQILDLDLSGTIPDKPGAYLRAHPEYLPLNEERWEEMSRELTALVFQLYRFRESIDGMAHGWQMDVIERMEAEGPRRLH